MKSPSKLTVAELRKELAQYGFKIGPVVQSTRPMLEKKLAAYRSNHDSNILSEQSESSRISTPTEPVVQSTRPVREKKSPAHRTHHDSDLIAEQSQSSRISTPSEPIVPSTRPTREKKVSAYRSNDSDLLSDQSETSRISTPTKPIVLSTRSILDKKLSAYRSHHDSDFLEEQSESSRILSPIESRALNHSRITPKGYERRISERGVYGTPGSRFSPIPRNREIHQDVTISKIPKWIMICAVIFTVILFLAYFLTAYPKTVNRGRRVLIDTIYDTIYFIYNYAVLPVFVALLIGGVGLAAFSVYKNRKLNREKFERQTMELVDKIADRVRESGSSGMAEQHIHDALIPPTRRTERDWVLWNNAVNFVNNVDSRMRSENRVINGVECNVWVWANAHDTTQTYHGGLDQSSPQSLRVPERALTHCLKIRGLINTNHSEDDIVKREVYIKLRPIVPAHFAIVRGSEPCVYVMFKELYDAKTAFDTFHTQWIRGNLVSVKYVRDERYSERFPEVTI